MNILNSNHSPSRLVEEKDVIDEAVVDVEDLCLNRTDSRAPVLADYDESESGCIGVHSDDLDTSTELTSKDNIDKMKHTRDNNNESEERNEKENQQESSRDKTRKSACCKTCCGCFKGFCKCVCKT
ncbi:unnamed protein product, partial [Meganyctiphanes norvegica]